MTLIRILLLLVGLVGALPAHAETVTIAAASDLKFAMDEIVVQFKKAHPGDTVRVTYGSSGKFQTQIQQGAPFDLYFSADIALPRALVKAGLAASDVTPYAVGRLVLWSGRRDASRLTLASLTDPSIKRIAIANPKHAPYGARAEEALRAAGVWDQVQSKLIYGETISQAAQFVETGNAEVGLIALSLAKSPALSRKGGYWLVPERLHTPLLQGFIMTKRAANNPGAQRFARYMSGQAARSIMTRYGFVLPLTTG